MCTTDDKLPPAVNFVLPGDDLPLPLPLPAPGSKNAAIKIGPGLAHLPPDAIVPVTAGELNVDEKKRMIWVEGDGKRVTNSPPLSNNLFSPLPLSEEARKKEKKN